MISSILNCRSVNFRQMQPGEETRVIELVSRVFYEFVAPLYSDEGVTEFMKFADAEALAERLKGDDFLLIAESLDEIIGIIEIRVYRHIALFFVAPEHQRRGIGRKLWRKAFDECMVNDPNLNEITVNSSPNAVSAYRALGFIERGKEKTINGIRFVPMAFKV